jgi:hypothetical protein
LQQGDGAIELTGPHVRFGQLVARNQRAVHLLGLGGTGQDKGEGRQQQCREESRANRLDHETARKN